MREKIEYKDDKMICKYEFENYKLEVTRDLSGLNYDARKKAISEYLTDGRRQCSHVLYGYKFHQIVEKLFHHLVIWYPNFDNDMAKNRNFDVKKETLILKGKYQNIRDLFIKAKKGNDKLC
jgi:hypothetical protein